MDADRFDSLARSFSTGSSRRRVLAALSGSLLGTLAVGRLSDEAAAKSCKKKCDDKKTKKAKKACKEKCDKDNRCPAGSAPCGTGCCSGDGLHYCCTGTQGSSCCEFEQGCSFRGLCTICDQPTDPCQKANCNEEGQLSPPFVPKCASKQKCYVVTSSTGVKYGQCHDGCPTNYSLCIQPDGTPHCCHTNPAPPGTPAQCVGGYCVASS